MKLDPFAKIKNKVLKKSLIGLLIFVVILTITLLVRFLNFSGAIIGFVFYFSLSSIAIYEFSSHYKVKKWQQFLLIVINFLTFLFPFSFYQNLLQINGFQPSIDNFGTIAVDNLRAWIIQTFIFYQIYILFAIIVLFIFAINKANARDIPKMILFYFVVVFISLFSKFIFIINFNGILLFIMIVVATVLADTFAYFGGKLFGNKIFASKLAPKISPNKTIEGTITGIVVSLIFILIWGYTTGTFDTYNYINNVALFAGLNAVFLPIFAVSGDLFFSAIKRNLKIKDFSVIMPEHGGLLDRFDSLSFVVWFISLIIIFSLL